MLVGMLSCSAKTVNLSARPSPFGVFADADAVAAFFGLLQLVGIIDRLGDPQPPALVPRHANRLAADLGLRGKQFDMKPFGHGNSPHRLFGRQRLLHHPQRLVLPAAKLAGPIIGDFCADVDILERRRDRRAAASSSGGTNDVSPDVLP